MSDQAPPPRVPDTGHVWDGNLRELTNPPPRWWIIAFHASWIFVLIYAILYPMIPLVHSHTKGILGWTSIKRFKERSAELQAIRAPFEKKLKTMSAAAILADPQMKNYTIAAAKVLFGDNCAACHGAGGQGNPNFPVLADDDWLYGGTLAKITQSITDGRHGVMPAFGHRLSKDEIDELVEYVRGLPQGQSHAPGKALFTGKAGCFACHGLNAKGNQTIGSANLTDAIWRFSGTEQGVRQTITHGVNDPSDPQTRNAQMPAWGTKLTPTQIKKLAIYVHELGGGQ